MNALIIATLVVQIILSLILVVVVLFQSGNQQGLSGSIAGGAETFFGKNKGRTLDAKLKKWTSVVAILFLISSIALSFMVSKEQSKNKVTGNDVTTAPIVDTTPVENDAPVVNDTPDEPDAPTAE